MGAFFTSEALEQLGRTAALSNFDDIASLHQIGGDVDLLAVDGEVGVAHQLTGLTAGSGETQTIHNVIQTALNQDQQVIAGLAGSGGSALIVSVELLFQNTIDELDLLLLSQLECRIRSSSYASGRRDCDWWSS